MRYISQAGLLNIPRNRIVDCRSFCASMGKVIGRFYKSFDRNDDTAAVNAGSTPQSAVAASTSPRRSSDMTDEGDLFGLYQL